MLAQALPADHPSYYDPIMGVAWAVVMFQAGETRTAEKIIRDVVQRAPDCIEAHRARALMLSSLGRYEEAHGAFTAALELAPKDDPHAHFFVALTKLTLGNWTEAWPHYERRLLLPEANPRRVPPCLRWTGRQSIAGKTVLVHAPDGDGDAIMFARYVPALAARGARVVLAVDRPLMSLLRHVTGLTEVVDDADNLPPFNYFVDRLSLPGLFGTTPDTVPLAEGYLQADPQRVAEWRARLPKGRKVGLVWKTKPGRASHVVRSMLPEALTPILAVPGFTFVNLQVGPFNSEGDDTGLTVNPAATLEDYADTAAIMANLDLVVSVDTSSAHLAGALGVPVWMMLSSPAEWRWLCDRETTPWYQSMRLFRSGNCSGDWLGVTQRVAVALAERPDCAAAPLAYTAN